MAERTDLSLPSRNVPPSGVDNYQVNSHNDGSAGENWTAPRRACARRCGRDANPQPRPDGVSAASP